MSRIYRQWVKQYQDDAWSLARYLLKDVTEAEDATQEAFASLWQHRDSIDPQRVKPWLMKVTRNECFDRLRRRRPETDLDDSNTHHEDGPMMATQQQELSRWLAQAIATLGEPYRSLVVLRDVQQQSYEELGQSMNMSTSQVKVYLYRARKRLQELLADVKP